MLNYKKCIDEYRLEYDAKEISAWDMVYISMYTFSICGAEYKLDGIPGDESIIEREINECLDFLLKNVYAKNKNMAWISYFENLIDDDTKKENQATYFEVISKWKTNRYGGRYQKDFVEAKVSTNKFFIAALGLVEILNNLKEGA